MRFLVHIRFQSQCASSHAHSFFGLCYDGTPHSHNMVNRNILLWQDNFLTSVSKFNLDTNGDCLFVWFLNVLVNYEIISRTGPKTERLTIVRAATRETELGDHDFCLSRSHYTDTDPTSRKRAATAGIEPGTSSPRLYRLSYSAPYKRRNVHIFLRLCKYQ